MRLATKLLPAVSIAAFLLAGIAHAETRTSAVLGAEAGYGSNPYLSGTQDQNSASIVLSAAPTVSFVGPTSNLDLTGRIEQSFFTQHFGDTTSWSLGANAAAKLSQVTDFSLRGGYASQVISGIYSGITATLPTEAPIPVPDPSAPELAGQRTKTLSGSAGLSTQVALRDTLNFSADVTKVDYGSSSFSSYTSYGASVGIRHVFSDIVSAGVSVDYSKTDYDLVAFGTFRTYSPSANATVKLAPRLTLDVRVGAAFSKTSAPGGTSSRAYFSGNANLCNKGERGNFCIVASRSIGATGQAGSSAITLIGANYGYSLTPRSSIGLGGSYSAARSIGPATTYDTSYVSGYANYTHQLNQRLSFVVNARYTNPIKSIGIRNKSFYGGVGVTYRLGR